MKRYKNGKEHLFIIHPERYRQESIAIIRKIGNSKTIIYVTLNKTCTHALALIKDVSHKFFFIGCGKQHTESEHHPPCLHCPSPDSLVTLSLLITTALDQIPGEKVVVFDSISTLFVYHKPETVVKFLRFLVNKMREVHVGAFFFVLKSDMKSDALKRIMLFMDDVR